jgi:rhodanese-related sulfurtransferase
MCDGTTKNPFTHSNGETMRKALFLSVIVLMCVGVPDVGAGDKTPDTPAVKSVSPEEFDKARKEKDVVVIDVRSPEEFAAGRVPNAINIPVTGKGSEDFEKKATEASKGKTPLIYCMSGGRSARAAQKMRALGIRQIIEMPGGWAAWTQEKKEVEKGPPQQ